MTTFSLPLPAPAWFPTASPANYVSARIQVRQSDVTVPSPRWIEWLFADDTDNFVLTQFQVPVNFLGSPQLKVYYKMSAATTGTVVWGVRVATVTPDDTTPIDTDAFTAASDNVHLSDSVPDLAGALAVETIDLDYFDGGVAGDWICLCLWRDGDGTYDTDDADSDVEFLGADFLFQNAAS